MNTLFTAPVISMVLSIPALVLSAMVAVKWTPEAVRATIRPARERQDWLVIGIAIGFIGLTINMAWWTAHYGARVAGEDDLANWLYGWGATVNNISRYAMTMIACWCHLRAYQSRAERSLPTWWLVWSLIGGLIFAWWLAPR